MKVEVSTNGGADFTSDGLEFVYEAQVQLVSLVPSRGLAGVALQTVPPRPQTLNTNPQTPNPRQLRVEPCPAIFLQYFSTQLYGDAFLKPVSLTE